MNLIFNNAIDVFPNNQQEYLNLLSQDEINSLATQRLLNNIENLKNVIINKEDFILNVANGSYKLTAESGYCKIETYSTNISNTNDDEVKNS